MVKQSASVDLRQPSLDLLAENKSTCEANSTAVISQSSEYQYYKLDPFKEEMSI